MLLAHRPVAGAVKQAGQPMQRSAIDVTAEQMAYGHVTLWSQNHGLLSRDFALPRVTDERCSLPSLANDRESGLGRLRRGRGDEASW